jgi:hypothetical protein
MFYMQVTYVFAHQVMGGTFTKHPSGNTFKNWALPKFNIVNKSVDLLQKGVALFRGFCLLSYCRCPSCDVALIAEVISNVLFQVVEA